MNMNTSYVPYPKIYHDLLRQSCKKGDAFGLRQSNKLKQGGYNTDLGHMANIFEKLFFPEIFLILNNIKWRKTEVSWVSSCAWDLTLEPC